MATIAITITNDKGTPLPSRTSVELVHGDELRLLSDGSKAVLYCAPALAKVLSPAPDPVTHLDGGTTLTFAVISSEPGVYHILIAGEDTPAPTRFPAEQSSHLYLSPVFHATTTGFPVHTSGGTGGDNN